ncbi:hypothetical protein A5782_16495 [Mycobacterium sp. 852002-40037_SCH5390672]|nr:hypothetical protein A5782_16495 [Mycobacterium sp. 852002-40037_SCH5390672]
MAVNSQTRSRNDPNTLGGIDDIFGIRLVVSTRVSQGHAAVLNSKIAVNIVRRCDLEIMANPHAGSMFQCNQIHYRAEIRSRSA